jgi:hypothetical protein
MHHGTGDVFEYHFIGELERVDNLEKCRNILQARRANFACEAGDIEQTAAVGPTRCESLWKSVFCRWKAPIE